MEEVKHIKPPTTKQCAICQSTFVVQRTSGVYCSNSCKCKAYQIRQRNNQSIKGINKVYSKLPGHKEKSLPVIDDFMMNTDDNQSIIDYQKRTITKLKSALDYVTIQARTQFDALKSLYDERYKSLINENKLLLDKLVALESENQTLKSSAMSSSDMMIAQAIKGVIHLTKK